MLFKFEAFNNKEVVMRLLKKWYFLFGYKDIMNILRLWYLLLYLLLAITIIIIIMIIVTILISLSYFTT